MALGSCSQNWLFSSGSSHLTTPGRADPGRTLCYNTGSAEGNSKQLVASQGRGCRSQKQPHFLQQHLDSTQHQGHEPACAGLLPGVSSVHGSGAGGAFPLLVWALSDAAKSSQEGTTGSFQVLVVRKADVPSCRIRKPAALQHPHPRCGIPNIPDPPHPRCGMGETPQPLSSCSLLLMEVDTLALGFTG